MHPRAKPVGRSAAKPALGGVGARGAAIGAGTASRSDSQGADPAFPPAPNSACGAASPLRPSARPTPKPPSRPPPYQPPKAPGSAPPAAKQFPPPKAIPAVAPIGGRGAGIAKGGCSSKGRGKGGCKANLAPNEEEEEGAFSGEDAEEEIDDAMEPPRKVARVAEHRGGNAADETQGDSNGEVWAAAPRKRDWQDAVGQNSGAPAEGWRRRVAPKVGGGGLLFPTRPKAAPIRSAEVDARASAEKDDSVQAPAQPKGLPNAKAPGHRLPPSDGKVAPAKSKSAVVPHFTHKPGLPAKASAPNIAAPKTAAPKAAESKQSGAADSVQLDELNPRERYDAKLLLREGAERFLLKMQTRSPVQGGPMTEVDAMTYAERLQTHTDAGQDASWTKPEAQAQSESVGTPTSKPLLKKPTSNAEAQGEAFAQADNVGAPTTKPWLRKSTLHLEAQTEAHAKADSDGAPMAKPWLGKPLEAKAAEAVGMGSKASAPEKPRAPTGLQLAQKLLLGMASCASAVVDAEQGTRPPVAASKATVPKAAPPKMATPKAAAPKSAESKVAISKPPTAPKAAAPKAAAAPKVAAHKVAAPNAGAPEAAGPPVTTQETAPLLKPKPKHSPKVATPTASRSLLEEPHAAEFAEANADEAETSLEGQRQGSREAPWQDEAEDNSWLQEAGREDVASSQWQDGDGTWDEEAITHSLEDTSAHAARGHDKWEPAEVTGEVQAEARSESRADGSHDDSWEGSWDASQAATKMRRSAALAASKKGGVPSNTKEASRAGDAEARGKGVAGRNAASGHLAAGGSATAGGKASVAAAPASTTIPGKAAGKSAGQVPATGKAAGKASTVGKAADQASAKVVPSARTPSVSSATTLRTESGKGGACTVPYGAREADAAPARWHDLLVGGFPPSWSKQEVKLAFSFFGGVEFVTITHDVHSPLSGARNAHVWLMQPETARKVAEQAHNKQVGDDSLMERCMLSCRVVSDAWQAKATNVASAVEPKVSQMPSPASAPAALRSASRAGGEARRWTLFIDELPMLSRPEVEPAERDCEVFLTGLPVQDYSKEDLFEWFKQTGKIVDLNLLNGTNGRPNGCCYIRYEEHDQAAGWVGVEEFGVTAVWSESERLLQRAQSAYGSDAHCVLEMVVATAEVQDVWMLSEAQAHDTWAPKPSGKQLHFSVCCDEQHLESLKRALAEALASFHESLLQEQRPPAQQAAPASLAQSGALPAAADVARVAGAAAHSNAAAGQAADARNGEARPGADASQEADASGGFSGGDGWSAGGDAGGESSWQGASSWQEASDEWSAPSWQRAAEPTRPNATCDRVPPPGDAGGTQAGLGFEKTTAGQ